MKTTVTGIIIVFSFFVNEVHGQEDPMDNIIQDEATDTVIKQEVSAFEIIELLKAKDCTTPLKILDIVDDIDFRDRAGGNITVL